MEEIVDLIDQFQAAVAALETERVLGFDDKARHAWHAEVNRLKERLVEAVVMISG